LTFARAGGELTANNPVLINEYLTSQSEHPGAVGDPAQSWLPGADQWLKDYIFTTPVSSQAYQTNFLDLALLGSDVGSLVLNGVPVPASDCTALAGSLYDTCNIPIAAGAGEISDANPFLLLIDGGTPYDSYFTFAGATFSPGASPPPPTTTPEPGSLALLGAGLAGQGALRRRAKAQ
jgi:IgGFc binding protein/PEP-CTERM motif